MTATTLLVLALAAFRLTRLVNRDTITEPIRQRVLRTATLLVQLDRPVAARRWRGLFDFLACPWCVGMHVAAALVGCYLTWPTITTDVADVLAVAAVVGLISERA